MVLVMVLARALVMVLVMVLVRVLGHRQGLGFCGEHFLLVVLLDRGRYSRVLDTSLLGKIQKHIKTIQGSVNISSVSVCPAASSACLFLGDLPDDCMILTRYYSGSHLSVDTLLAPVL